MKKLTFVEATGSAGKKELKHEHPVKTTTLEEIMKAVDITNAEIDALILQAQQKANNETAEHIDSIINTLVEVTNKVSAEMVKSALEQGYVVNCELVLVEIGNKSVWIDPLRVASF